MMPPPLADLEVMHARAVLHLHAARQESAAARTALAELLTKGGEQGHVERGARTLLDRIVRADAAARALLELIA